MDNVTALFKLLSDKTRLRILLLLNDHELCVCQLMGALGMPQPRISQQLAILKRSKIVSTNRTGKWIYYSIDTKSCNNDHVKALLNEIPSFLGDSSTFELDQRALRDCFKRQEATGRCDLTSFEGIRKGAGVECCGNGTSSCCPQ